MAKIKPGVDVQELDLSIHNSKFGGPFLLNEYEISMWAFRYCLVIQDDPKIRQLITNQYYCYLYCLQIEDISEMWNKITSSSVSFLYCLEINDRPEVRKNMIDSMYGERYKGIKKENII